MPRFLTPARICLLALLKLYQAEEQSLETSLPLLDFLAPHTAFLPGSNQETVDELNALWSSDIAHLTAKLQLWSSKYPGRTMYDILLWTIWDFKGLDSIHTLIHESNVACFRDAERSAELDADTRKSVFTAASPFGQYVRRCWVEFTRLPFDDLVALWSAFVAYRAPTHDDWLIKNPETAARARENGSLITVPASFNTPLSPSYLDENANAGVVDAEMLLQFAIHRLQKVGARVPPNLKQQLDKWMNDQWDSGTQSLHIFMAFFEHWRAGQYTMALEKLHQYFDYSLGVRSGNDNTRAFYQYALLHLSVLHADFECWNESVDAMNECIATARENQDTACLNFALSWLLYLRQAHPSVADNGYTSFETITGVIGGGSSDFDEVEFLRKKAKEGKHWILYSSTLLEEAKLELHSGGSLSQVHALVLQSSFLNIKHDLRTLIAATWLFQSACLDRLAQAHLASRTLELTGLIHSAHCSLSDSARAACRSAYRLIQAGFYVQAMKTLNEVMPAIKGVLKLEQRIKAFAITVHLHRMIHCAGDDSAKYFLKQLRPFRADPEIAFEFTVLEVEVMIKQGLYEQALKKVGERLNQLKGRSNDIAKRLLFLILKARIFAIGGQAIKGFSLALRATATAERNLLLSVQLEGIVVLGKILIDLMEFSAARDIAESALPHALESQNIMLIARMFVVVGESCVGFAGHSCKPGSAEQTRSMRRAQDMIERGRLAYERAEDQAGILQCLMMKSKIARWSGDDTSAAQADEKYTQLLADCENLEIDSRYSLSEV